MAPSRASTLVAGSALVTGLIFLIYLIQRKKGRITQKDSPEKNVPVNEAEILAEPIEAASQPELVSSQTQHQESAFTVSQSWAILSGNSENEGFPESLSPCQSASMIDSTNYDDETQNQSTGDDTMGYESIQSRVEFLDEEFMEDSQDTESETLLQSLIDQPQAMESQPREQEMVFAEELHLQYDMLLKEHTESSGDQMWTKEDITEALMAAQNPQNGLTDKHAQVLVYLLTHNDSHLKHVSVQSIARCASFTNNQDALRKHGCLPKLSKLLELQQMAMWLRHKGATTSVEPTINAVTNMAVNTHNNAEMEPCVPTLVDISLDKDTGETVCLSSLQALTNLSVTSQHHGHYTRLVQRLYEFLSVENTNILLQALKILVNLSCNPEMVPHLLAARAPEKLLDMLHPSHTKDSVILRFVTLLANILHVVKEKHLTSSSLPTDDKAPSPETMYSALLGINNVGNLKNKVFLLCKHESEEIRLQSAKVYNQLK